MKAVGALPTEERVQKMNIRQWLWFYYNIIDEEKKKHKYEDNIIEYITSFINPELAKAVRDNKDNDKQDLNTTTNTTFEEELKAMMNEQEFVELPSSGGYQSNISEEDFIKKAQMYAELARTNPNHPAIRMLPTNKQPRFGDDDDIMFVQKTNLKDK